MGAPDPAQTQYFADVLQTVKEQQLDLGDLGQQVLLAIADQVGVWKIIGLLIAFMILGAIGTVWGALKFFRGRPHA